MITSKLLIAFILGFTLVVLLVAFLFHKELGVESCEPSKLQNSQSV